MNVSPLESLSEFFRLLGQPIRIQVLLAVGRDEACVCHIEAALKVRQAVLSQHLMVLRDSGLMLTRRSGRFIYYRLANPALIEAVTRLAETAGIPPAELQRLSQRPAPGCPCPLCSPGGSPDLTCSSLRTD
jgi:DNA-binding transcriptional ArsR family regulator